MESPGPAARCDERRPSCNRCIKSKRTCRGYPEDTHLIFRQVTYSHGTKSSLLQGPEAQKQCILRHLLAVVPRADPNIETRALSAFFHDYCLVPENRLLSRGYLEGLETLISEAKPDSSVLQAAKAVAFANLGGRLGMPDIVHKARMMYSEMLHTFQVKISHASPSNTAELLMTVVLLGLYEMITATEDHPSNHGSHSSGIYAILDTQSSPLGLLQICHEFQMSNPLRMSILKKEPGILHAPALPHSASSLDDLLVESWPLLRHARRLLSSSSTLVADLHDILHRARMTNEGFIEWAASHADEWRPRTIAHRHGMPRRNLTWISGRVDEYLDLYVAGVWNAYRKNRLFILDIIIRCVKRLEQGRSHPDEMLQVEELITEQMAAIPFHLMANVRDFAARLNDDVELTIVRGKAIGGLLLMHPLYVAANLSCVNTQRRAQMKDCLSWIGTTMGIGEAAVLSRAPQLFPNKSVANGYALIWAGMLFTDSDEQPISLV